MVKTERISILESAAPSSLRPEHQPSRSLATLVDDFDLDVQGDPDGVEVSGITVASNQVQPGDIFVALPGARTHGAKYAPQAAEAGSSGDRH